MSGVEQEPPVQSYGLSPIQQGLLFHHLSATGSGVDFEQIVMRLEEDLDLDAFRRAWEQVLARHEALRASFHWEDRDDPVQRVHPTVRLEMDVQDWRSLGEAEQRAELEGFLRADRERGFDLRRAPLLRLAVRRLGSERYSVVWSFHHILMDGRSFPIVLRELFAFYEAELHGGRLELEAPRSYRDHIEWLARQDFTQAEPFWRERLAGFGSPSSLPGAASPGPEPAERGEQTASLSRELTDALRDVAERLGITLNTLVQGAWALLLSRYSGEDDVLFGATRACRRTSVEGAESIVGPFINTLPVRALVRSESSVEEWLRELQARERAVRPHEHTPLVRVQGWSEVRHGQPLFESLVVFDHALLDSELRSRGEGWERRHFELLERTNYPLTLYAYADPELLLKIAYDRPRFDERGALQLLGHLETLLAGMAARPQAPLGELALLAPHELRQLDSWNATATDVPQGVCVHQLIEAQVERSPEALALAFGEEEISYRELDTRANRLAHRLRDLGVGPEVLVGLCAERSIDLVVAVLGILKAGGAYVPLDPDYPRERLRLMLEDASVDVLVTEASLLDRLPASEAQIVLLDGDREAIGRSAASRPSSDATPENLAYVIYTSGSTGRPKGVMVEHRNVLNFFVGMDERVPHDPPGVWLAVTSLSFDISVLELLWTLARGFKVVVHADERQAARRRPARVDGSGLDWSLLYFASDEGEGSDKYRLLLEGARFADTHGFAAVWTPERHFHAFGGLYPNPAVTGAAVAAVTRRVAIRAGSVVLPLHHPIRVAEEWAVVDNLSRGRVGISFASGWQPNDFILRPENYADAKAVMFREIETVRRLWRGEVLSFPGPKGDPVAVRTLPRPVQPELPVWVTTAGNADTYRAAGEIGAYVLTHLLGQTLDEVEEKVRAYRAAWEQAGHGPDGGHVTLMLHSFVGDDVEEVRETVRGPMLDYLRSSLGLIRNFASAWTAFKRRADGSAATDVDLESLSPEELEGLLEYSFERYFATSALFGTPESCLEMVERITKIGVDEVACLIDFGVAPDLVLDHLRGLDQLRERASAPPEAGRPSYSLADAFRRHGITHLQCTPSMASMLVLEDEAREALGQLDVLLVGGEAFPHSLATQLAGLTKAQIVNMYGPTETTIWSSTHSVAADDGAIPIGRPIANTELLVLDADRRPLPVGVPGELYIGGAGVARGYLGRPELTAERFVPHPLRGGGARLYRTGDVARRRPDAALEYVGRTDHQLKIRGHRVELGEIEKTLAQHEAVREAVVVAREETAGDVRLVAYVIPELGATPHASELSTWLREWLPEPMLPALFIPLETFPLTPNRKIDRKALPSPEAVDQEVRAPQAPPASELEEHIVEAWKEVLKLRHVGTADNFFDLGGHSLLAVKLHRRLKALAPRDLSITDLFRFPTVRALARYLGEGVTGASLAPSRERGERRRQSLAQRRALRARRQPAPDEAGSR
jgi:natural product biosynthesis luciferase-like monooxygenase protein